MFWVILIITICVVVYYKKANDDSEKNYTLDDKEVNTSFVQTTLSFIEGYINLRKAHSVSGWISVLVQNKGDYSINLKLECCINNIDGQRGNECLEMWICADESFAKGDWQKIGEYMKKQFSDSELHYAYQEREYYSFEENSAIVSHEVSLPTIGGAKLIPSLKVLKDEVLKLDSELSITIGEGGMMIKSE